MSSATAEEPREPIWEVAPGIALLPLKTPTLPPATRTNSYLIGGARGGPALLVEPATPDPKEQARLLGWLRERRVRVAAIFCTHHHGDHVGGAEALRAALRAPLWAHRETAARLEGELRFDRQIEDNERLDALEELGGLRGSGFPETRAIHTPGHAPGHLCLLVGRGPSRALIAGDMVAGVGTILVEPGDGDMALYLRSLERMIALHPSLLLPAHGPPIEEAEATLRRYIAHRLEREAKVLAALRAYEEERAHQEREAEAARPMALVPSAYADAPKLVWPLAARSVEAHLIKLERDGLARREGEGWRATVA